MSRKLLFIVMVTAVLTVACGGRPPPPHAPSRTEHIPPTSASAQVAG